MSKFRFSVLIPVYNRQNYLQQTLDSVLQQTFQDFELIVVDDGSTDRSLEILASYADKITLLQQPNSGPEIAVTVQPAPHKANTWYFWTAMTTCCPSHCRPTTASSATLIRRL